MKSAAITDLLEFLEFIAKVELGPASGLPYEHVTFTVPEMKAALREMNENSELFLRFRREKATRQINEGKV